MSTGWKWKMDSHAPYSALQQDLWTEEWSVYKTAQLSVCSSVWGLSTSLVWHGQDTRTFLKKCSWMKWTRWTAVTVIFFSLDTSDYPPPSVGMRRPTSLATTVATARSSREKWNAPAGQVLRGNGESQQSFTGGPSGLDNSETMQSVFLLRFLVSVPIGKSVL